MLRKGEGTDTQEPENIRGISILNRVPEFENELWSQVATGSNTGVIWANTLSTLELRFSPESSKMMLPS